MLIWRPAAVADRKRISTYIAQDNPIAAIELVDMLIEKAELLVVSPDLGRPGRLTGTRELVVHKNYILVYRATPSGVDVLRVLHAAMQWPTRGDKK